MEFNSHFQAFGENDVLSFSDCQMCKMGKFKNKLNEIFEGNDIMNSVVSKFESSGVQGLKIYDENSNLQNRLWTTEGKGCEILRVGAQDWIKGRLKIKISVEFEPETPKPSTSTLDDIRQMINE